MIVTRDLGLIDYAEAVALQDALVQQRLDDAIPDTLLLLEHPPVITLGRRASLADVFLARTRCGSAGLTCSAQPAAAW